MIPKSLTGRMPIWTELMRYVDRRPLTGYGYESFWTAENIEDLSGYDGMAFPPGPFRLHRRRSQRGIRRSFLFIADCTNRNF